MLRNSSALLIFFLILFLSSCTSDGPADAAREWAIARTSQKGGEALRLTCNELRSVVQSESFLEAGISGFLQLGIGLNPDTEADLTEVDFDVVSTDDRSAVVEVNGDAFLTIMGAGSIATLDELWVMIEEGDQWRWCGLEGEDLSVFMSGALLPALSNDPLTELGDLFEPPKPQTAVPLQPTFDLQPTSTIESRPNEIAIKGNRDDLSGDIDFMAIDDGILYAGIGRDLAIIDIAKPTQPTLIGMKELLSDQNSGSAVQDIVIDGNFAYILIHSIALATVNIVDISDLEVPFVISSFNYPLLSQRFIPLKIALWGDTLALGGAFYIGAFPDSVDAAMLGLKLINVSNPSAPQEIGSIETQREIEDVVDIAYVENNVSLGALYGYVLSLNVSNPAAIVETEQTELEDFFGMVLNNSILYLVQMDGLLLMNVENPNAQVQVGTFMNESLQDYSGGCSVAVDDDIAFYTFFEDGSPLTLIILDVSNSKSPIELSRIKLSFGDCQENNIAIGDDVVFVGIHSDQIHIIDASDPKSPKVLGILTP